VEQVNRQEVFLKKSLTCLQWRALPTEYVRNKTSPSRIIVLNDIWVAFSRKKSLYIDCSYAGYDTINSLATWMNRLHPPRAIVNSFNKWSTLLRNIPTRTDWSQSIGWNDKHQTLQSAYEADSFEVPVKAEKVERKSSCFKDWHGGVKVVDESSRWGRRIGILLKVVQHAQKITQLKNLKSNRD
jgi:hypothetical protein